MNFLFITNIMKESQMKYLELVQAAKMGDLNAFNELVLGHQDQVFNLAYRTLGNLDTAQDISQDAFILAFRKIHQFRGGSFKAWLLKIVTNLCYSEMRTWKRHPYQSLEPTDKENNINESSYWMKDPGHLPEDEAEMSDLRNVLEHGLNLLSLKFRTVVTLVDVHEMDYKEVSRITGIPIGTVKSRLARGRMQLGNYLRDTAKSNMSEPNVFNMTTTTPPFQGK